MKPASLCRLFTFHSVLLACPSQTNVNITVQIHNSTDIAREHLTEAQKEAARILATAGINVVWLECTRSISEAVASPECSEPCHPSRLDLRIYVRPA